MRQDFRKLIEPFGTACEVVKFDGARIRIKLARIGTVIDITQFPGQIQHFHGGLELPEQHQDADTVLCSDMTTIMRPGISVVNANSRMVQGHVEIVCGDVDIRPIFAEAGDALQFSGAAADLNSIGDALVHSVGVIAVRFGRVDRQIVVGTSSHPPLGPFVLFFGKIRLELTGAVFAFQKRDQFDGCFPPRNRLQNVARIVHQVKPRHQVGNQFLLHTSQPPCFMNDS